MQIKRLLLNSMNNMEVVLHVGISRHISFQWCCRKKIDRNMMVGLVIKTARKYDCGF